MKLRFAKDHKHNGHTYAAGDHEVPDAEARSLLAIGVAEKVEETEKTDPHAVFTEQGERVVRLRFRRNHAGYAAGSKVALPESEAWPLVNEGHADCDPPPGIAGQPFPPSEVTEDPAPLPRLDPVTGMMTADPKTKEDARKIGKATAVGGPWAQGSTPQGELDKMAEEASQKQAKAPWKGKSTPKPAAPLDVEKKANHLETTKAGTEGAAGGGSVATPPATPAKPK